MQGAEGGAGLGYLLKERVARVEELVAALHAVAGGGSPLDPQVVEALGGRLSVEPADRLLVESGQPDPDGRLCAEPGQPSDGRVSVEPGRSEGPGGPGAHGDPQIVLRVELPVQGTPSADRPAGQPVDARS